MNKQVIVMRKDLGMRKGKMIAQGAHASMAVLLDMMETETFNTTTVKRTLTLNEESPVHIWLRDRFTKICVSVDSEDELKLIYHEAKEADLPCALIEDSGATEFGGVPTLTCCAIGPWSSETIDKITGDLKLL